jgi:nitroreductase
MDLIEAIYSRRAVRAFAQASVDRATIRKLIDAAIQAPSAVNTQPWFFTVIQDPALLARMSRESKEMVLRDPPRGLPAGHFRELLSDPKFDIFYGAPTLILVSSVVDDHWAVVNCALAAQNLMLAARSQGLGTCWIGFAEGWLRTESGRRALDLPQSHVPVAPIIVGRPISFPDPVPRKDPIIHWIPSE